MQDPSQSGESEIKVKRPQDVANRGELDVLILHETAGILLVQTKAVGNFFFLIN